MTVTSARAPRRRDALSRQRIVEAAIELLDADGESGLTVRALTSRLSTGRGAIYHHVAGVDDLLAAAADDVIRAATERTADGTDPTTAIRDLSLAIFDALDAHPWVGTQLAREPLQPAVLRIWKSIAVQLQGLGIDGSARSDAGAALASYIFGSAAQFAAGARRSSDEAKRQNYLDALASAWTERDDDQVVRDAASHLRDHDDRKQFMAGIDIFLKGIT
ncbi:helix-turn-helix transcriptional regulator [Solihabitans fulvus]|uniref:Helix-turn-helix transcriptional regulator n=1 Tax=Solihabitans fulvus TaxID=1892852 RepID=A0A5B2WNR2_9PSEU|nr:TetR family transcriptional regulator [Solihabitans fulvus]KAA2252440.1 helix-turn-helix transcriptional regulator [Solihabitans fulvus]